MTDREQIIAAAKEAGICFRTQPPGTREVFCWQSDIERFYAIAFKAGVDATVPKAFEAGAASRDAEIAELVAALDALLHTPAGRSTERNIAISQAENTLAKVRRT
jgi:hypothetical protein